MNRKILFGLIVFGILTRNCTAEGKSKPVVLFFRYEGYPRAHMPSIIWSFKNAKPRIDDSAIHDDYWKHRFLVTPKFLLPAKDFESVELLLSRSSEIRSAYVIESLFEYEQSTIRYISRKDFDRIRIILRDAQTLGYQILDDWPLTGPEEEVGSKLP